MVTIEPDPGYPPLMFHYPSEAERNRERIQELRIAIEKEERWIQKLRSMKYRTIYRENLARMRRDLAELVLSQ